MAGLACGVPVVTNFGDLSEPLWSTHRPASAASKPDAAEIALLVDRLLEDPEALSHFAAAGREFYDCRFALKHSIRTLLHDD